VGVIALISDGYWKDAKNNSDLLVFGILCIPCVASGLFLSMVLHRRLFAEKSSDTT
jgi:hypothetical protein